MSDTSNESPTTTAVDTPPVSGNEGKKFQIIEGRRYNDEEDVAYLLPNDDDEADRIHQQHWIFRYALQCNYHSPIKQKLQQGITVIDSGCGPATWTFEMAKNYPNSKIIGLDISFVFPEAIRPPNVDLKICNITKELPFDENSIGYIHHRFLVLALTKPDWEETLRNAYRVLAPGGYVELVEPNLDRFENMGPLLTEFQGTVAAMLRKKGIITNLGDSLEGLLREAQFTHIQFVTKPLPMNHTNKVGTLWWQDFVHTFTNLRPMLATANPSFENPEVFSQHLDKIGNECAELHTNFIFCIAYGQKPYKSLS
ncbi:S-adenosyl-L-methionine-dependent methyltransferase [Pilobolus umbonatus]|nr:S-adenosyl-L-methionine-dependent methyltransferase [Pilobolus umbonatus]